MIRAFGPMTRTTASVERALLYSQKPNSRDSTSSQESASAHGALWPLGCFLYKHQWRRRCTEGAFVFNWHTSVKTGSSKQGQRPYRVTD